MLTCFFLIHLGLQKKGLIDPPIKRDHVQRIAGTTTTAPEEKTSTALKTTALEETEA